MIQKSIKLKKGKPNKTRNHTNLGRQEIQTSKVMKYTTSTQIKTSSSSTSGIKTHEVNNWRLPNMMEEVKLERTEAIIQE